MPPSEKFSVERIANLARIDVAEDQRSQTRSDLDKVLNFIQVLDELTLDDVEPFFGAVTGDSAAQPPIRTDVVSESIPREQVLENAPDHDGQFYRVPPVFD